jgi:Fe-S-cluster containining protein
MYPCTRCGCCCKRIGGIVEAADVDFPYEIRDDGSCSMLSADNLCMVYDDRPLICNMDKFIEVNGINKETFYKANIAVCNSMMDADGVPESFRIKT